MKHYLKSISKTNSLILNKILSDDEVNRFSASDYQWANSKESHYCDRHVKKGDIYQFEFGKNFEPEMSYEHRGLVIGVRNRLLYVLPIFSFKPDKHKGLYDRKENPKGDLYLLKADSHEWISHDSVLKLHDLRTVSDKRILYKQKSGHMDIESDEYKEIEFLSFTKLFPQFAFEINRLKQ